MLLWSCIGVLAHCMEGQLHLQLNIGCWWNIIGPVVPYCLRLAGFHAGCSSHRMCFVECLVTNTAMVWLKRRCTPKSHTSLVYAAS